jgi:hypothetical protein
VNSVVIQPELAAVQEGPQDVAVRLAGIALLLDVLRQLLGLRHGRPTRDRGQIKLLDHLSGAALAGPIDHGVQSVHLIGVHEPQGLRDPVLVLGRLGVLVAEEEVHKGRPRRGRAALALLRPGRLVGASRPA